MVLLLLLLLVVVVLLLLLLLPLLEWVLLEWWARRSAHGGWGGEVGLEMAEPKGHAGNQAGNQGCTYK